MEDPSKVLPRDPTGSYLHLKLKRFANINDLSMKYAKKTWKDFPQDAQVDLAPTSRSSCRQCHKPIQKGEIRMRLLLQCHKGCKNSAYFHNENDCFWKYPETKKLEHIEEIYDLDTLPEKSQGLVKEKFRKFRKEQAAEDRNSKEQAGESRGKQKTVPKEVEPETAASSGSPRKRRKTK